MKQSSIRWRIQRWHGALLVFSVTTMSVLFFMHERSLRIKRLELELSQKTSALIPKLLIPAPVPRARRDGQPRPPPPRDEDRPFHPELNPSPQPRDGRPPRLLAERYTGQGTRRPPPDGTRRGESGQAPQEEHATAHPDNRPPREERRSGEGSSERPPRRHHPLPPNQRPPSLEEILGDKHIYYIVWNWRGEVVGKTDNAPEGIPLPDNSPYPGQTYVRNRGEFCEAVHYAPRAGSIITGISKEDVYASLNPFAVKLFGGSAALILFGLSTGWWMLRRETAQLTRIASSAERIAHGNLSERIDLESPSQEIADLSKILNESFSRLEKSFEQQVRFTADASHDLRTPVAVILSKCQLALSKDRTPEAYREAISTCEDSAKHMKKMIESLLELARFDSGESRLNLEEADFSQTVMDSVELLRTLGEKKRIKIIATIEPCIAYHDTHRIQQVCINLISNAIKYSPFGTEINVTVSREDKDCLFVVADDGMGIDEKDLPFLFDRFFRGKPEVEGDKNNAGLGLAISKAIVLAHGGTIQAMNRVSGGALFRITIPLEGPAR